MKKLREWTVRRLEKAPTSCTVGLEVKINVAPRSEDDPRKLIISCGKNSDGAEFAPFGVRLNTATMIYELDPDFERETAKASISPPERAVDILLSSAVRRLYCDRISRDLGTPRIRSKGSPQGTIHIFLDASAARHCNHSLAIGSS